MTNKVAEERKSKDGGKELTEIKLMSGTPKDAPGKMMTMKNSRAVAQNSFMSKGTASLKELTGGLGPKQSPNKMHMNMAKQLAEQRMKDTKESFVRTVLTARHECEQFNTTLR